MTDRGLVLVLGENQDEPRMDSNGSGKSSVFEALDWSLFGVIPKGDHVDSVISDDISFVGVVTTLWDEDSQIQLVVQRSKERGKSGKLKFWKGPTLVEALDTNETQRLLEIELGLDREVFHATTFYGQSDALHFADVTESKRMDLLGSILPELASVDVWGEVAKAKLKVVEDQQTGIENECALTRARISELHAGVADLALKKDRWEQEREARLLAKQYRGQEVAKIWEENKKRLVGEDVARSQLAAVEVSLTVPVPDYRTVDAAIQSTQKELQTLAQQEGLIKGQQAVVSRALLQAQTQKSGQCSQCGQMVTAEHLALEVSRLQSETLHFVPQLATVQSQAGSFRDMLSALQRDRSSMSSAYEIASRENQGKLLEARRLVESFAQIRAVVDGEARELAMLRSDWASIRGEVNPFLSAAGDQQNKIMQLESNLGEKQQKLDGLVASKRYFEFWVEAFANKGLKSYILDNRLGEMNEAANYWVKLLTGGTIWVRFETQKMGRSTKRLSNDVNIRVFRYNPNGTITERNYKSWSGGEKKRVAWAIDFGLSRLVAARAKKRWDTLILDEVFKHVDTKGGEAVVEMLQHLRKERSSIFVVEHDGNFQSQFEQRIIVRKHGGHSIIVEALNGLEGNKTGIEGVACATTPSIGSEPIRKKKQARKKKDGSLPVGPVVDPATTGGNTESSGG